MSPTDCYQLRVALGELEALERTPQKKLPDIEAFLERPPVHFVLRHIQNFIWTLRRLRPQVQVTLQTLRAEGVSVSDAPRIYIDMTSTVRSKITGGIARVCYELASAARDTHPDIVPTMLHSGRLYEISGLAGPLRLVEVREGDAFVIVDSFWDPVDEYIEYLSCSRTQVIKKVVVVHDVIPLAYPAFFEQSYVRKFKIDLDRIIPLVDGIISVSRASAQELTRILSHTHALPPVAAFHLGARFPEMSLQLSEVHAPIFEAGPVFLSVGTVEPKKGLAIALDAFDLLWHQGVDVKFVIVGGRSGWTARALTERIKKHSELHRKLFWLTDVSDAELQSLYRRAYCLVQASAAEGFGLPLIEAEYFGLPVIASDIAVLKEVASDSTIFFRVCDPVDLAEKIRLAISCRPSPSRRIPLDWHGSLKQLASAVRAIPQKAKTQSPNSGWSERL